MTFGETLGMMAHVERASRDRDTQEATGISLLLRLRILFRSDLLPPVLHPEDTVWSYRFQHEAFFFCHKNIGSKDNEERVMTEKFQW